MFSMRNRPQPRGVCSPASLASMSGVSTSGGALAALVGDPHLHVGPVGDHADLDRESGRLLLPCSMAFMVASPTAG